MNKEMGNKVRKHFWWVFVVILVVVAASIVLNYRWIYDFSRGLAYRPTTEMETIRTSLDLTDGGKFLFNASHPVLNSREEFNDNCQPEDNDEVAVFGCYSDGNIYIYNIEEKDLAGIREATTAHELLHAAYARMSEREREGLEPWLEQVYGENKDILEDDLSTYKEAEKFEELYVRIGTEVKKLPEILEEHYAKFFKNQDKVVSFYDRYIATFKEIEAELDELAAEIEAIADEIAQKTEEYETRTTQLNVDIYSFNDCANMAGCFNSESEFYTKRYALVTEQNSLEEIYEEIDELIDKYNEKVEKYNEGAVKSQKIKQTINPSVKLEDIEGR